MSNGEQKWRLCQRKCFCVRESERKGGARLVQMTVKLPVAVRAQVEAEYSIRTVHCE